MLGFIPPACVFVSTQTVESVVKKCTGFFFNLPKHMMLYTNYLHNILIIVIVNKASFYIKAHIIIIRIHQRINTQNMKPTKTPTKITFGPLKIKCQQKSNVYL